MRRVTKNRHYSLNATKFDRFEIGRLPSSLLECRKDVCVLEGSCQIGPRRLETDGSQTYVDMVLPNLRGTKTEIKILLKFDRNTKFLTVQGSAEARGTRLVSPWASIAMYRWHVKS